MAVSLGNRHALELENYSRRRLPRFLFRACSEQSQGSYESGMFRASSEQSQGSYNPSTFRSAATLMGVQLPLQTLSLPDFALAGKRHLTFYSDATYKSPLISFTSSLLIALTCARKANRDGAKSVQVAVFDTEKITSMNPIFPASKLQDFVNKYCEPGDGLYKPFVDEFLAYDTLMAPTACAMFDDLARSDMIYDLLPPLKDPNLFNKCWWPVPLQKLREKLFHNTPVPPPNEFQLICNLQGKFMGGDCQLALRVHLLSLKKREIGGNRDLTRTITASFTLQELQNFVKVEGTFDIGMEDPCIIHKYTSAGHGVDDSLAPELKLYSALVKELCADLMSRQEDTLRKQTGNGIVENACAPSVDGLAMLREMLSELESGLRKFQHMSTAQMLNSATLADLKMHNEQIRQAVEKMRSSRIRPATCAAPAPSTTSRKRNHEVVFGAAPSSSYISTLLASIGGDREEMSNKRRKL